MNSNDQIGLFKQNPAYQPLAHKMRPAKFNDYLGHEKTFKKYPFLKDALFTGLIIWGAPGVGKTTLATILANSTSSQLLTFSPVMGGVNELKKLIDQAIEYNKNFGKQSVIFIDEIHRFNKAQQDALLPYLEKGDFKLIGATTQNPKIVLNKALISRVHIVELEKLDQDSVAHILSRAAKKIELKLEDKIIKLIASHSNGDARRALNTLELIHSSFKSKNFDIDDVRNIILKNSREYDKNSDRHYDVISAFIKSMRGSDPDAALLWLAVMLEGGEDPLFIARRLIIFASEDVGNADLNALNLAVCAFQAISQIGMPEARITLSQVTCYLASTVKSNASYMGINKAIDYVKSSPTIEVPDHLKNHPPKESKKYLYPHDYQGAYVKQHYTKDKIPVFYRPKEIGSEKNIKLRLEQLARQ